ncbi:MAG: hypothetical protein OXF06_09810 [Bacteroidetes bacterium]|nr:hypothetical protein [Bacteroidota bacterium]MCY4225118.1 hypothetical protein [Bacteroidota bacterium]
MTTKNFQFSEEDFDRIGRTLGAEPQRKEGSVSYEIHNPDLHQMVHLEISIDVEFPGDLKDEIPGHIITAETNSCQLHLVGCTGLVAEEDFREVIFYAKGHNVVNALIVQASAWCQVFSNYDRRLLDMDYTKMPRQISNSVVAFLMAEGILEGFEFDEDESPSD